MTVQESQRLATDCPASGPIPLRGERRFDRRTWTLRCGIFLGLGMVFYLGLSGPAFRLAYRSLEAAHWPRIFVFPSLVWSSLGVVLLTLRTLLWVKYHPFPSAAAASAPLLTVVIPAYNEGAMVQQSIDSVLAAQYPADRLEIIVVDDGSLDDTWEHIQAAVGRHPDRVRTIRLAHNQGKRAALAAGFKQASGEILVTIDSDSVIEPQTLLAMAGPFRDPRIGAVAGKVLVYNRSEGILPRMLHVRFVLSFDFLRAAQSTYGTVYCCPGALSAYRASVIKEILEAWINQTFLGEPCTYGEDRAMTNYVLAQGFDAVYQRTAVVHTKVPATYNGLCRMFLRWDRSFIKEELHLARIVWRRPLIPRLITILDTCIANLRFPLSLLSLGLLVVLVLHHPYALVRVLFVIGALSLLNVLYYLHSEPSWDFLFGILYAYFAFFGLFWIFPAAACSLRSRSWMTR